MMDGVKSFTALAEACMDGLLLPLGPNEDQWNKPLRGTLYLIGLLWFFIGVAVLSDIFMGAIEVITSVEKKKTIKVGDVTKTFHVRIWNPTVANLSLLALGSSAPEILLSTIEIAGDRFYAADLG
eukprot:Trichotokara_eunicae@DN10860_c0_g1_i1.p1